MKWIDGYTRQVQRRRKQEWHKWFAWFPVTIDFTSEGRQIKVWLQYVMRKGVVYGFDDEYCQYEYKEIEK